MKFVVEASDLRETHGGSDIETIAAAIYNAFHGECSCTAHPFEDGLPWSKYHDRQDFVVETFRAAAIAAMGVLQQNNVGTWK
jgi:hypothetical protein